MNYLTYTAIFLLITLTGYSRNIIVDNSLVDDYMSSSVNESSSFTYGKGKSSYVIHPEGRKLDKMNVVDRFNAYIFGKALKKNIGFCSKCYIYIAACDSGSYKNMKQTMSHLASGSGCTVYATKAGCWSGDLITWDPIKSVEVRDPNNTKKPRQKGQKDFWQEFKPQKGITIPTIPEKYK